MVPAHMTRSSQRSRVQNRSLEQEDRVASAHDQIDEDVAAILGIPSGALNGPQRELADNDHEAPTNGSGLRIANFVGLCAMVLIILGGLGWGSFLVLQRPPVTLRGPMMADLVLAGQSNLPSASDALSDTKPVERVNAKRSVVKHASLRQKLRPQARSRRSPLLQLATRRTPASRLQTSGRDGAPEYSLAASSAQPQPHSLQPEFRGFIAAETQAERLARAERLAALDSIRLLRQR